MGSAGKSDLDIVYAIRAPIARIVPIEQTRKIRPISGYGQKIAVKGDIFADDSELWENA